MARLWPLEPARSRAEFARLLRDGRAFFQDDASRNGPSGDPRATDADAATASSSATSQLAGTPYRLVRTIGEGNSGFVWEAEHVELGRLVALKVLNAEYASSQSCLERFRGEARALSRVSHPNLVQTLDFGKSLDGRVFLAMELLDGETIETKLRAGPLAWREAARIASEAGDALAAAHAAGLLHRDLKPNNLMVTNAGQVKLLDFGVAVALGASRPRTPNARHRALHGFAVFGTPEYMAPEQVTGDALDPRADVYSLGCVLYEMLTGFAPFDGSPVVVMGKQLHEAACPPRERAPERAIPASLEAVVMRAMAKDPRERFASASAMRCAIEHITAGSTRRRTRARRVASGTLLAAAMLASAAASAQWTRTHLPLLESERAMSLPPVSAIAAQPATATPATPPVPTAAMAASTTRPADPPPRREAHTPGKGRPSDSDEGDARSHPFVSRSKR